MRYTKLSGVCDDGDCPTLYRDETTGDVLVQGYLGDGPATPAGEGTVRMTEAQLHTLLDRLGR